jgi:hypothetical protein
MKKIVLYIVYGDNQEYYDGAKFSILTFKHWVLENDKLEIVVLTEKPEEFYSYPVKILKMSQEQINKWSLNGQYHFRIKNRGLGFAMDELNLDGADKILFFDTDTYFHKNPLPLFDLINPNQAVLYLNEGLIYKRKRFNVYHKNLEGKTLEVKGEVYKLSKNSALWGSLMVGIMPNMRKNLEWADKLMLRLYEIVPVHTIEEFSLSESLLRDFNLVEGKKYVSLYSTSRKKEYASKVLLEFFLKNKDKDFNDLKKLAQNLKIKRPILIVLKQRMLRLIKNNAKN